VLDVNRDEMLDATNSRNSSVYVLTRVTGTSTIHARPAGAALAWEGDTPGGVPGREREFPIRASLQKFRNMKKFEKTGYLSGIEGYPLRLVSQNDGKPFDTLRGLLD
jgi:hypothetical protein